MQIEKTFHVTIKGDDRLMRLAGFNGSMPADSAESVELALRGWAQLSLSVEDAHSLSIDAKLGKTVWE